MASYTTLVQVELETALKVSSFVAKLQPDSEAFEQECKKAIDSQNTAQLVQLLLSRQSSIYALDNDVEIETFFQAMFSVIYTLSDDTKDTASIISSIATGTTSSQNDKPIVRLAVLVTLFNLIFDASSKCEVLVAILNYALVTKQTNQVSHLFSRVEGWFQSWELSVENQRNILQSFAAVLEIEGEKSLAVKALILYIESFKNETAAYPAEVEKRVVTAVVNAINSSLDSFADRTALLEALKVQSLSAELKPLVELLRIVCDGSLTDFQAFQSNAANKTLCSTHKIDLSELETNVKLLTLCALASQANEKVLSFDTVEKALQITTEEVELWVIQAIGEHLLEAYIDQIQGTITINRYAHLSFGPAHWRNVQAKLRSLRQQVATAVDTLQRCKTTAAASAK